LETTTNLSELAVLRSPQRHVQKKHRTPAKAATRSLVDVIAIALAAFTAQECLNFFATAGYDHA
jgi:hypothetical protein